MRIRFWRWRVWRWGATVAVVVVLLVAFNFGCVQRRLTPVLERSQPQGLYRVAGVSKQLVVLTIDDGPSSRTGEMLDLLAAHGATATFFAHTDHIEQTEGGEQLIRRMLSEGHELGNHMPSDTPSIQLSAEDFAAAFAQSDARLRELGAKPSIFRPAGGAFNDAVMGPVLARHGYDPQYILGSYLPWDVYVKAPKRYARQLATGAYPGAILVLHDGDHVEGRPDRTLITLRLLLEELDERGYRAVSLAEARGSSGE